MGGVGPRAVCGSVPLMALSPSDGVVHRTESKGLSPISPFLIFLDAGMPPCAFSFHVIFSPCKDSISKITSKISCILLFLLESLANYITECCHAKGCSRLGHKKSWKTVNVILILDTSPLRPKR